MRKIHTVLHAGLEDAVALELIAGNPSTKARRPKVTKHDARVPSLVALRWSDVDEDNATLHVQRSIVKLPGQPFEEKRTKTGGTDTRRLPVPATVSWSGDLQLPARGQGCCSGAPSVGG